jgi:uncharacterized protein YycO
MTEIIIGFSKSSKNLPISRAIMAIEDTPYSHAYIKTYNRHFNDCDIYQASKGMVNHVVERTFLEENTVIREYVIPVEDSVKMNLINDIRYKLGKPYSKITIAVLFLDNVFKRIGVNANWLKRLLDGDKAYICSELVGKVLKANKIIDISTNVDSITPKQLMEILNNKYN